MNSATRNKAAKLFERIIKLANEGTPVTFKEDLGGPALTVVVGNTHFHTFPLVTSVEEFIEYCYTNLGKE